MEIRTDAVERPASDEVNEAGDYFIIEARGFSDVEFERRKVELVAAMEPNVFAKLFHKWNKKAAAAQQKRVAQAIYLLGRERDTFPRIRTVMLTCPVEGCRTHIATTSVHSIVQDSPLTVEPAIVCPNIATHKFKIENGKYIFIQS